MDSTAGQLSCPGFEAFPPHSIQNCLQPTEILLIHVLGEGLFGPFQLLGIGRQLAEMTGRPAPLADPAVGIGRIVAENFPGFGLGRRRNPLQAGALQMFFDQAGLKGRAVCPFGQGLVRRRIDPRGGEGKCVQQPAPQAGKLGIGDRERGQILRQDVEERRPLDQGAQQGTFLA